MGSLSEEASWVEQVRKVESALEDEFRYSPDADVSPRFLSHPRGLRTLMSDRSC